MPKSLLLVFVTATVLTLYGGEARSQLPPIPAYETQAIEAVCSAKEDILHFLRRETEGEQQTATKVVYCIDKPGKQVIVIVCQSQTRRCSQPVATEENIQTFKRLLRILRDGSPGTDA